MTFLNEDNNVFTVMTSNDVSQLPPELTRSGRLDAMWYSSLPDAEERKEIFRIHLGKTGKKFTEKFLDTCVEATAGTGVNEGYTGAEIQEIVKIAMRKAFKRYMSSKKTAKDNVILPEEIEEAASEVIPISRSSKEKIAYLDNWAQDRARFTNGAVNKDGYRNNEDALADALVADNEEFTLD